MCQVTLSTQPADRQTDVCRAVAEGKTTHSQHTADISFAGIAYSVVEFVEVIGVSCETCLNENSDHKL